jgi:hypothetical protein
MAVFPGIPAEMPGVGLSCHAPSSGADDLEELPSSSIDIDWSSQRPLMDLKNLQFSLEDRDYSKIT